MIKVTGYFVLDFRVAVMHSSKSERRIARLEWTDAKKCMLLIRPHTHRASYLFKQANMMDGRIKWWMDGEQNLTQKRLVFLLTL